ncbi:hypothetical protein STEG23_021817, partial [Scotinomys teguina]
CKQDLRLMVQEGLQKDVEHLNEGVLNSEDIAFAEDTNNLQGRVLTGGNPGSHEQTYSLLLLECKGYPNNHDYVPINFMVCASLTDRIIHYHKVKGSTVKIFEMYYLSNFDSVLFSISQLVASVISTPKGWGAVESKVIISYINKKANQNFGDKTVEKRIEDKVFQFA